jgi:S1-C subfamily serine protease
MRQRASAATGRQGGARVKFSDGRRGKAITCRISAAIGPRRRRRGSFAVVLTLVGLLCAACGGAWDGSVGAILGKDNRTGRLFVREAPPGLGAAQAGIQAGDELTQIDGKPVASMSADDVHRALAGKVGTKVGLTVTHAGEARTVLVERGPLQSGSASPPAPAPTVEERGVR